MRRYEFYLRVVKTIFCKRAQQCSVYYIVVNNLVTNSNINFRSIMVKTLFQLIYLITHTIFKLKQYLYIVLFISCSSFRHKHGVFSLNKGENWFAALTKGVVQGFSVTVHGLKN